MHRQPELKLSLDQFCYTATCPAQVLVIDRPNGPANVLIDTVSLLLDREVSVLSVEDHDDALRALDYYYFDLIVVGLEGQRPRQMTILPTIRAQKSETPVVVIGRDLARLHKQYARYCGASDVITIPERAADLKALVQRMNEHYLAAA
jgi:DNA-binding NtrC family response regulator